MNLTNPPPQIKEVEDIDKTEFLNILSNEPSAKVCTLFGLLHQAVSTYYKQLRHLLLDNCPRRLDVLVKYISNTLEVCLIKRIFHKDDVLILRLQEKTKQLSLKLQEIKQQRRIELEIYIKPKNPEKTRKKRVNRYEPMTLDMYNSKLAEKKLKSVRSKNSLVSPNAEPKEALKVRKKRLVMKRREAAGKDDLESAKSVRVETQIEKFTDEIVSVFWIFEKPCLPVSLFTIIFQNLVLKALKFDKMKIL